MKPSERLRKILNQQCPELMELSFGCEVETWWRKITIWWELDKLFANKKPDKILWHPPTITHLLQVLWEEYSISGSGVLLKYYVYLEEAQIKKWWNYDDITLNLSLPLLHEDQPLEELLKLLLSINESNEI